MKATRESNPMKKDVLIAGAGLSGALIAIAIRERDPEARILMLEKSEAPKTSQTWSFHQTDISAEWYQRLQPFLAGEWSGQEVYFPNHHRRLQAGYASLDALGLARALEAFKIDVQFKAEIASLTPESVTLRDGSRHHAPLVIDARGFQAETTKRHGWQKFVGVEFEMNQPHGVEIPVIMDARVAQIDGFRFVYLLPFSKTKILVEDTCYSNHSALDVAQYKASIERYIAQRCWKGRVIREESGVLPIPMAYDFKGFWSQNHHAVPVGLKAELFQPVTGYSLPTATRTADAIAQSARNTKAAMEAVRQLARAQNPRNRYLRFLNRMLFLGAPDTTRYRLLERFYRLPEPLIERFYANQLTGKDQLRILTGKPPIPIHKAIRSLSERKILEDKS